VTTSQIPAIETVAVRRVYAAKPKPIVALDGIDLVVISSVGGPGSLFADVSGHAPADDARDRRRVAPLGGPRYTRRRRGVPCGPAAGHGKGIDRPDHRFVSGKEVLAMKALRVVAVALGVTLAALIVIPVVVLAGLFVWLKITEEAEEDAVRGEEEGA
jgi:hypothetical protein